jgi:hypothetical protein
MKAKILLGTALLFFATVAHSYAQVTAYANIFATVVAPVGINSTFEDHTGEIVVSQKITPGSLSLENNITASGLALANDGSAALASFSVTDTKNSTFDVTLPSENLTFSPDHLSSLSVSDFSCIQSQINTAHGNKKTITIGAKVNLPDNQVINHYSAQNQFPITLNYN